MPSRKTRRSISEVGESQPSTKPSRERGCPNRLRSKRNRYERSPEHTRRNHSKKNHSVEIGSFAKWIHSVVLDPSLKFPQFVLYSGQSHPLEHVYCYKFAMSLVTNDEVILCKAFPNTLSNKAFTWFTLLKPRSIDSWHTLEKLFMDKFSTVELSLRPEATSPTSNKRWANHFCHTWTVSKRLMMRSKESARTP